MRKGFTLIELLVVIAIIAVLATIVLASLAGARQRARITNARATIHSLREAVDLLANDTGQWPGHKTIDDIQGGASGNEVWDLTTGAAGLSQTDGNFLQWHGPYMRSVPLDPWGNPYFFDTDYDVNHGVGSPHWAAVVGSFGPNGVGQNVYDTDDIIEVLNQ